MRNICITVFILMLSISVNAQQDLVEKIGRQAVEIEQLKNEIKTKGSLLNLSQQNTTELHNKVKELRDELEGLKKFKADKKSFDDQLKQKEEKIASLEALIATQEEQIKAESKNGEQTAKNERENGRIEALVGIINNYQNTTFDDLLTSSTLLAVERDRKLLGNKASDMVILTDLNKYFTARELLEKKLDNSKVESMLTQLGTINQKSSSLEKLKEVLENYATFNAGLHEMITKLTALDKRESVAGMDDEIKKLKFNKILPELSAYIFNYDFNFSDYPYLSDIIFEIIKRKQPNPDADISDLLKEL